MTPEQFQALAGTSLGMCCEQFQSQAHTVKTIACSMHRHDVVLRLVLSRPWELPPAHTTLGL